MMEKKTGDSIMKLLIATMSVLLIVVIVVGFESAQGRSDLIESDKKASAALAIAERVTRLDLVRSQRSECERIKLDRKANVRGWRIIEEERRTSGKKKLADRYRGIARDLEARSPIDCVKAFPIALEETYGWPPRK